MENEHTRPYLDAALSTYPMYVPEKDYDMVPTRSELNERLLNHYKYREIGFETVGRFLDELKIAMCAIMPYYNEMLKSVVTMADLPSPFDNVDFIEEYEEERSGEHSSTSKGSGTTETNGETSTNGSETSTTSTRNKRATSDTPQNVLDLSNSDVDRVNYASEAEWKKDDATTTGSNNSKTQNTDKQTQETESENTGTSKDTVKHTFHKIGNQGVNTYAHDMNEFRTAIIDVVDQIINDERINELFMLVY